MRLATTFSTGTLLLLAVTLLSCRGQLSEKPPVQPQQNMYFQERFNAQEENAFFEDGRSLRMPVEGTVARGQLNDDTALHQGLNEDSSFVENNPLTITSDLLYRGRDRYEIYCSVCHGGTGDGRGIIFEGQFGFVPPSNFHLENFRVMPDGQIYSAIYNGVRTMPSYRTQIPVEDRWAIVAYVRALQESQNQTEEQIRSYNMDPDVLRDQYTAEQEASNESSDTTEAGPLTPAERGEQVFAQYGCQGCHTTDGGSGAGLGPTLQGVFGSTRQFADGTSETADDAYILESINNPSAQIIEGYNPLMQPFAYIPEDDKLALVEFIKSLSDN